MPPLQTITGEQREEQTQNESSAFLLYHGASHVTGQLLGDFLGVPRGRDCEQRIDYLIRWGSRSSVQYAPDEHPINTRASLRANADKFNSLREMDNGGIPVPAHTRDRQEALDEFGYPFLGREDSHTRGEDINLILQERDAILTENDFYVDYIPTELEYRMHVVDGEVVKVHEKRLRREADNHPYIRNSENGWVFLDPREEPPSDSLAVDAVGSMGMDFGAVDVVRGEDGEEYVLEVNSAPSLDEANLQRYGEALAEMAGIEDYPGLEAVEFPDDENEETE